MSRCLAPALDGQADDRHLGDGRLAVEDLFDLGGQERFSPTDDRILKPADDPAAAPLGHRRQVARAQPSVGAQRLGRLFWHVEVAPRPVVPVLKRRRPREVTYLLVVGVTPAGAAVADLG
jgi:hypothetical protein